MSYWVKCDKCNKEFTHDEWSAESELVHEGWTWGEKHKDSFCKKHKQDVKDNGLSQNAKALIALNQYDSSQKSAQDAAELLITMKDIYEK